MQSRIFLVYINTVFDTAFHKQTYKIIPYVTVVIAHTVNVFIKKAVFNKMCQSILFKVRYCTGIEAKLLFEAFKEWHRKNHVTDSYS